MKFWFCEKCNARLTDEDLQAGRATEAGSQAVYCAACMKSMNPMASSAGDRKTGAVGRSTVVLAAKRPSASTARISGKPSAPATNNSSNSTTMIIVGGVLGIFGLLMIALSGGRNKESSEPIA